jgi:hypothetical protein
MIMILVLLLANDHAGTKHQQHQQQHQEDQKDSPAEAPTQKTTSRRRCGISDTHKPGHWRQIPVDCTNSTSDYHHEGCGYFWDDAKQGMGYVYETQGCTWEFMNATQLLPCMEAINRTMYFIGDSLIRYIMFEVKTYFSNNYAADPEELPFPVLFQQDWKRPPEQGRNRSRRSLYR